MDRLTVSAKQQPAEPVTAPKPVEKIEFEETIALATPAKPAAGGLPLEVQKMDFKSEHSMSFLPRFR